MHIYLMKSDRLDHEQNMSLRIIYQKNATPKHCPEKPNATKTKVEGKRVYEYILIIFRMQYDNKTQGMTTQWRCLVKTLPGNENPAEKNVPDLREKEYAKGQVSMVLDTPPKFNINP